MTGKNKSSGSPSRISVLAGSLGVLLLVGAVIASIGWAKYAQVQAAMSAPPPPESPVTVRLFQPQPTSFRSTTVVVGTALAERSVVVRNEETGVVTAVAVTPGGTVRKGDLLVQFDDRVEQAALKAAQATLRQAQIALQRAGRLQQANANSAQDLDVAQADADRAAAEVDRLAVLIDRKRITAEMDATVGLFDLHVGQYLDAGTDIVRLEGIADYLHVDFAVPAHVADSIRVGDTVTMRIDQDASPMTATIIALDSRSDPQSRSLTVRARLDGPPKTLLPGDSVLVSVDYGPANEAILVPQTAIRRGPEGTSVFVAVPSPAAEGKTAGLRAKNIPVQLAGSEGTMSRIVGGVSLNDQVVADGSFKLADGLLLAPTEQPSEAPSNTGTASNSVHPATGTDTSASRGSSAIGGGA